MMTHDSNRRHWRQMSVDGVFERLYARLAARYADALLGFVLAGNVVFVAPVLSSVLLAFWRPTLGEFLRCLLAFEIALPLAGPATFVLARRLRSPTYRWIAGDHAPDDAPAAWASTVAGLPRWVMATGLCYAVASVPPTIYAGSVLHFRWYGYPIFLISLGGLIGVVLVFYYLFSEQYLRPVAHEIAAHLPEHFEPPGGLTLGAKALVLIPTINFFSAVVVAALTESNLGPDLRLGQVALLAALVSLTLSLVLTLLFRNSVLRRIEDLRGAIRRVDAGDLQTRVAPVAGDEFDDMGASFNEMVRGLRERESLREHNAELVVDLQRQADQLRDSRARIVAASDAARRRVEHDLHDGAQQRLVLLRLKVGLARRSLEHGPPAAAAAAIDEIREELDRALADLRDLAHGIYPAVLENEGLPAALSDAAERAAIPTAVDCDSVGRYPPELETAVYFCCLEALQNAAKHAGHGAQALVTLTQQDGRLVFEVSDDGQGFAVSAATTASAAGIQNMTDRIGALGGALRIDTTPGHGTKLSGTIPLTLDAAPDPASL